MIKSDILRLAFADIVALIIFYTMYRIGIYFNLPYVAKYWWIPMICLLLCIGIQNIVDIRKCKKEKNA